MPKRIWQCVDRVFNLDQQGEIMGILNVTPDSFSDGGKYSEVDLALEQAAQMIEEGAAIIDIGGESTRPGAAEVTIEQEIDRTVPVIQKLLQSFPKICVSIDTSKPEVALQAGKAGATIINDVTGFRDPKMIALAAETGMGAVVMHMQGTPRTMQKSPSYKNVVEEVKAFFVDRYHEMTSSGVKPEAILFDPGIGFGKKLQHNLELLNHLDQLEVKNRPLLLGVSRKSFIGMILESDDLEDRSWPTIAITAAAIEKGVPVHRVHEVKANFEAMRMMEGCLGRGT